MAENAETTEFYAACLDMRPVHSRHAVLDGLTDSLALAVACLSDCEAPQFIESLNFSRLLTLSVAAMSSTRATS